MWPLSVSTDRIGLPALRCQGILARLGVEDRSGDGGVFETYPALGLHLWGMRSTGYKKPEQLDARKQIWTQLTEQAPWLQLGDDKQLGHIHKSSDDLDAVVAGLIAAAARRGLTEAIPDGATDAASEEGWIVIPRGDALRRLTPGNDGS